MFSTIKPSTGRTSQIADDDLPQGNSKVGDLCGDPASCVACWGCGDRSSVKFELEKAPTPRSPMCLGSGQAQGFAKDQHGRSAKSRQVDELPRFSRC